MSLRTSTLGFSESAMAQMQTLQSRIAQAQNQIGSGLKLQTARDNPIAAGAAVALDRAEAEYRRYGDNATVLANRLGLEEGALAGVNDLLARLREIAVQGSNGTLTQSARAALLPEVAELKKALLAAANTADAEGRYLFGGTRDASAPFTLVSGGVSYGGDQSQRQLDVAPGQGIADTDAGSEVFMRLRTGNGTVTARAAGTNTGTGLLMSDGFTNQSQWDGGGYRVIFGAGTYQVLDASNTLITSGSYVRGQSINFRGYQVTIDGQPNVGDTFTVQPSPAQSVFALVDNLTTALQTPDTGSANAALLQNRCYAVLQDLDTASRHLVDVRAGVGARLNALDHAAEEREGVLLNTRATLSQLRDLDYAEALTRLARETTALQAAQQTFSRVQALSLFSFLR